MVGLGRYYLIKPALRAEETLPLASEPGLARGGHHHDDLLRHDGSHEGHALLRDAGCPYGR